MKKDFTLDGDDIGVKAVDETANNAKTETIEPSPLSKPENAVVAFPENTTNTRNADFGPFYGQGFDDITAACQCTL
ncbi:hypothetical protein HKB37_25480, partial [Vibrio parahaemolyticus]